jgi:hypothetical protein
MYCQTNCICEKCNKEIKGKSRTIVELSDEREMIGNVSLPIQKELFILCDKCYDSLFGKIIAKRKGVTK